MPAMVTPWLAIVNRRIRTACAAGASVRKVATLSNQKADPREEELAALAALVVTAPLLSACSGEDGPSPSTTPSARAAARGGRLAVRGGDGHRGQAPQRQRPRAGEPAGPGVAASRRPTCSSPRTRPRCPLVDRAGLFAPVDQKTLDLIPAVRPRRQAVDRLPRPVDGGHLQHRSAEPGGDAGVDPRLREAREGRPHLLLPTGADFQAIVSAVPSSRARTPPATGSRAWPTTERCTTATTWCSSRSTPARSRPGSPTTTTGTDQKESGGEQRQLRAVLLRRPGPGRLR